MKYDLGSNPSGCCIQNKNKDQSLDDFLFYDHSYFVLFYFFVLRWSRSRFFQLSRIRGKNPPSFLLTFLYLYVMSSSSMKELYLCYIADFLFVFCVLICLWLFWYKFWLYICIFLIVCMSLSIFVIWNLRTWTGSTATTCTTRAIIPGPSISTRKPSAPLNHPTSSGRHHMFNLRLI